MPHIGVNYLPGGPRSLLLIGESHYLPAGSSQHLTPESWYRGKETTLNDIEKLWISTSKIIAISRAEGFKNKAHSIYRNAFWEINKNGPRYDDYKGVADDVVYYNYFRRPALQGKSLAVHKEDIDAANDFFLAARTYYRPAMIVFLSVHAHKHSAKCDAIEVPLIVTPHPGCAHWNRVSRRRGNKRGRDLLGEAVATLWSKTQGN